MLQPLEEVIGMRPVLTRGVRNMPLLRAASVYMVEAQELFLCLATTCTDRAIASKKFGSQFFRRPGSPRKKYSTANIRGLSLFYLTSSPLNINFSFVPSSGVVPPHGSSIAREKLVVIH